MATTPTNNDSTVINKSYHEIPSKKQELTDPEDLDIFVSDLLESMQSKFKTMGDSILSKMDDMGSRIDDLEKSISEMVEITGVSETNQVSPGTTINETLNKSNNQSKLSESISS